MTSPTTDRRQGLVGNTPIKAPVTAVATTPITLYGEQNVDGVDVKAVNASGVPDRILVTAQADATTNGIYDVSTAAWTRSADSDGNYDIVLGTQVVVTQGGHAFQAFIQTVPGILTIGTSALTWVVNTSVSFLATVAAASGASLIGFVQAGIGAVARTVQAKLRERTSLEDFGGAADFNGTTGTDNAAAFAAAYAALPASGGKIELGVGSYYTTQPWVSSGTKRVLLVGQGSSEASNSTGSTEIVKGAGMTSAALVLGANKSEARNFNVRGLVGNTGDGISVTGNQVCCVDVGSYQMGGNGWRVGTDAGTNANNFHFERCRGTGSTGEGFLIDDGSSGGPNANSGILLNCVGQSNGSDGYRLARCAFVQVMGGTWEANSGCGGRVVSGSKFNELIGGDYEANTGTAQISIEAGATWTKVRTHSLFYESVSDAGTLTQFDMPSSTSAGWFSKGVFRMQLGNPGGPSDVISGAGGGYTRFGYGGDATGGALTDATAQIIVASNGLHLGKSTSGLVGFYSAAPVAQQTTAVASSSTVANSGTTVNLATTFDGYTLQQITKALRNYGLLA